MEGTVLSNAKSNKNMCWTLFAEHVIRSYNNQIIANIYCWLTMCQALFEVIYKLFNPYKDYFLPLLSITLAS